VPTVLIASPEHLNALKGRDDLGEVQAFADTEALRALEVISRERPSLIALERLFAATSRGTALINRIKADPGLTACEIRIVTHDGPPKVTAPAAAPSIHIPELAAFEAPAAPPLDYRGTRRMPRTRISASVEVLVDGNPATLVDVSAIGAQVLSPTILKPNQRLRFALPDPVQPVRVSAGVVWAFFEMPKGTTRYRAGIEFFDPDMDAVADWLAKLGG
jgi:hypothetical protein